MWSFNNEKKLLWTFFWKLTNKNLLAKVFEEKIADFAVNLRMIQKSKCQRICKTKEDSFWNFRARTKLHWNIGKAYKFESKCGLATRGKIAQW